MTRRTHLRLALLLAGVPLSACTQGLPLIASPPRSAATTTTGPWTSMIYAARTDSGVFVIDLGWTGTAKALRRVLGEINATPEDVRWAFLTHAHRDHIGGWATIRQATFVLGRDEVPFFAGDAKYRGPITAFADKINSYRRPTPEEVRITALGSDTSFVLGADTLRAYQVPGHTSGSTVYLFRGTLFAGDAVFKGSLRGFQGARREFSDSTQRSRASMRGLVARIDSSRVGWTALCTAHAKCAIADSALRYRIQQ